MNEDLSIPTSDSVRVSPSIDGNPRPDWTDARTRAIIEKARARRIDWREIKLSDFDPDLEGQVLRVWGNAPSVLLRAIRATKGVQDFVTAISELTEYSASELRDLFDAWEDALAEWLIPRIFDEIARYNQERLDFLHSSPTPTGQT